MISFYDSEGNVPLHSAVHGGDIKAVELCLKSGAKISTQQHDLSTPVHLACAQVSQRGKARRLLQAWCIFHAVLCAIDGQDTTRVVAAFELTLNCQILMQIHSRDERDILGGRQTQTWCWGMRVLNDLTASQMENKAGVELMPDWTARYPQRVT